MTRTPRLRAAAIAVLVLATIPVPASAQDEAAFLRQFAGTFSGSGTIVTDKFPTPTSVDCTVTGQSSGTERFELAGTCRALLIFQRSIGASVEFDPASGAASGVYTGSESGPAQLSGRRNGETLAFDITWGRLIHGDTNAQMQISGDAAGFSIRVTDRIEGQAVIVSDLRFNRA